MCTILPQPNKTLRGILRVLANPTLSLEAVKLQLYTILDSEPLHDLKRPSGMCKSWTLDWTYGQDCGMDGLKN